MPLLQICFHNYYLYLKKISKTPAATLEHEDALPGPQHAAFLTVSLSVLSLFTESRRMWIILGVNANALILAVLTRSMIQDIHWTRISKHPGMLQLGDVVDRPQRRGHLQCAHFVSAIFPPDLPLPLKCLTMHTSIPLWFHLVIMRHLLK